MKYLNLVFLIITMLSINLTVHAAVPVLDKTVLNMSGNTSAASGHTLFSSVGEMVIGQMNAEAVIQSGYFNEFIVPVSTATVTPTITPTLIPTETPLYNFDGEYISEKYIYTAPHPVRGHQANFNVVVKEACDIDVDVYTVQNRFVMSFNLNCPQRGKYQRQVNMSNLANGIYMFVIKAKVDNRVKERKIKKIALVK